MFFYTFIKKTPKMFFTSMVLPQMFYLFFYSNARSPRCVGRSARNFARWSYVGRIL